MDWHLFRQWLPELRRGEERENSIRKRARVKKSHLPIGLTGVTKEAKLKLTPVMKISTETFTVVHRKGVPLEFTRVNTRIFILELFPHELFLIEEARRI